MPTHATLYFSTDPKIANTTSVPIPSTSSNAGSGPDVKVLNFALALETLEAELYRQAVARLTTGGVDFYGKTITGLGAATTDPDVAYLTTFARVETEHQKFLEGALGGNWAVSAGAGFDFGFADTNLFGKPALTRFQTVSLVYAAEQTGISAYLGGAGPGGLTPGGAYLGIAASILGTEARHTTAVAILLNANPTLFPLTTKLATAPLAGDTGTAGGHGLDTALAPDSILNGTPLGMVAADTTIKGDGIINPISGPNGFVFVGT